MFRDCTITEHARGGVLVRDDATPAFVRCRIVKNRGRGVRVYGDSAPTFEDCLIAAHYLARDNNDHDVGGVSVTDSRPRFVRCVISGNAQWSQLVAGGVHCTGSAAVFAQCVISGNSGGGFSAAEGTPRLENCLIVGNLGLAVLAWAGARPSLISCTIADNFAPPESVGQPLESHLEVRGCIVWGNSGSPPLSSLTRDVRFCCIEGGWEGEGNIDRDPRFQARGSYDFTRFVEGRLPDFVLAPGDYRLRPGSPCQDAVPPSTDAGEVDLAGMPRLACERLDMGAYEVQDCVDPAKARFVRGDADGDGRINITDAVAVLGYLFLGRTEPWCMKSADADDSGAVNVTDPIALLRYLFLGGGAPRGPFPGCGQDPTADDLSCRPQTECAAGE